MKETLIQRIKEGIKDMCYIWAKEMRSTITDEGVLIFFLLVPILYPLLYSWAYSNEVVQEVPVAVVDLSHSHQSRQFIRNFDASPNTKVAYYCNSVDEASQLVGKQVVHGIIYFPEDFQERTMRMEKTHVGVYCDMALMLTYKAIYQTAQAVASEMNAGIQIAISGNQTNREDEIQTQPLAFDEVEVFNPTGGYGSFLIPCVLILIIQQTLLLGIGLGAGTARESNRYRDLVPVSRHYNGIFRIVLGKSLAYFMIYSVIAAYLTIIVPRLFGYTSLLSGGPLLALMVPYILACIFFGMMLSCLVRYRENVILLVVFTSIPFLFLAGISWPQSNMPGVWRGIATLIPSTFGVRGFVRLNTMGASLADIRLEYQALWIQTTVYFFITCLVYRFQIISARNHANERIQILKEKAKAVRMRKEAEQSV
ncbi:MAG: ABC transporter permease [Prevotella sp.]|nr:ABC transporter permease [Prevotella sp.]